MPHILETYALGCKSKISEPMILEKFFPVPINGKYISLNCEGGMAAKNYPYWNDVVAMIKPALDAREISILQFGGPNERPVAGCINLLGATTPNQTAYAIKNENCILHLGVDSFMVHLADMYGKKIVAIYSISPPEVCGPYFSKKENVRCIVPNFEDGYKYSYNPAENPPKVMSIRPEQIASAVLDLLGIEGVILPETLHMGERYHMQIVECVPNQVISPEALPNIVLHLRYDYVDDSAINFVYNQLAIRKCTLVTDRAMDVNILKKLRQNIEKIAFEVKDEKGVEFVKNVQRAAIPCLLVSFLTKEELTKLKLPYSEYGIIFRQENKSRENCKNFEKITKESFIKSNRFILSNQKIYTSKAQWKMGQPINSFDDNAFKINDLFENGEFWKEQDFFYIFNR